MTPTRYVLGLGDLTAALRALPEDMRARTLGAGVKAAIQPIKIAAKRFARRSRETGALEESITDKVVIYPESGKAVGLVGPDRAYYAHGRKLKSAVAVVLAGKQRRKPANYAHLVENGHIARDGTFVPPKPIFRPAVVTTTAAQGAAFFYGVGKGFAAAAGRIKTG